MENPQLEDGYVKIATSILDAFVRIRISGESRQLLDYIIRKTYGWNKKADNISISQFQLATGMCRASVTRGLKKLKDMNIITSSNNANTMTKSYSFIKQFLNWKPIAKKRNYTHYCIKGSSSIESKVVAIKRNTIDSITKDTNTKDSIYSTHKKFVKPTYEQLQEYAKSINYNLNATIFMDHYEAIGWKVGRNPMKDWKATVRTWRNKDKQGGTQYGKPTRIVGEAKPIPGKYKHLSD